jgi:DNA-binding NarL/FixJ family response regulator
MAGARRTGVIVDQHPLLLQAVENVLARTGVTMVGKALSGERALRLVHERQPDLLVTELQLSQGKLDGIGLVCEARRRSPNLRAIVLSAVDDPARIAEALRAGAAAYVIKTVHPDDLATAIRQAFKHSLFLADSLPPTLSLISRGAQDPPELTRRELEILQLVARGHSNAEAARILWVTEQTVKFHLSNVYRKLNVSNRTEASRWAHVHGLLPKAPAAVGSTPAEAPPRMLHAAR